MTGGNLIDAGTENGRSTPNLPAAGVKPASSPSSRGTGLVVAQKPVHRPEVADAAKESSLIAVKRTLPPCSIRVCRGLTAAVSRSPVNVGSWHP